MDAEERALARFVPTAKEIMDDIRGRLPDGTHFGLMILAPGDGKQGRVIAITTDRDVVAPAVAQWALTVLPRKGE